MNEYLEFRVVDSETRKTMVWRVVSVKQHCGLGNIVFRPQWRKYVFQPEPQTVFDSLCLKEIVDFLERQTNHWRSMHRA